MAPTKQLSFGFTLCNFAWSGADLVIVDSEPCRFCSNRNLSSLSDRLHTGYKQFSTDGVQERKVKKAAGPPVLSSTRSTCTSCLTCVKEPAHMSGAGAMAAGSGAVMANAGGTSRVHGGLQNLIANGNRWSKRWVALGRKCWPTTASTGQLGIMTTFVRAVFERSMPCPPRIWQHITRALCISHQAAL